MTDKTLDERVEAMNHEYNSKGDIAIRGEYVSLINSLHRKYESLDMQAAGMRIEMQKMRAELLKARSALKQSKEENRRLDEGWHKANIDLLEARNCGEAAAVFEENKRLESEIDKKDNVLERIYASGVKLDELEEPLRELLGLSFLQKL